MKLSRTSLRFPLGLLAGFALLIGCQSASGPDPVSSTEITVKGTVEFSDTLRLPDFGVWRTNNAARTTDTGRGSVVCTIKSTGKSYDCSQSFALKNVLGSDLLIQEAYALGVNFATLSYSQTGNQTQLSYLSSKLKLYTLESKLIRDFNTSFKQNKATQKATPADLIAYYAKLLLDGDLSVKDSALPKGMVADTVKNILVQVAAQNGVTAKALAAKAIQGLTSESMIRSITDALLKAGVKIDTAELYPPAPVRVVDSLKVASDLIEGEGEVAVSGSFAWETKAGVRRQVAKVVTATGVEDLNIRVIPDQVPDLSSGSWVLTGHLTLQAKKGAKIGLDTLIVSVEGDSGKATSRTTFRVVRGDTVPPVLAITQPAGDTEVANATDKITVVAKAFDTKGVAEVKIGNAVLTTAPFSAEVDLAVGYNFIVVQAKDIAGNVSIDSVVVQRKRSTTDSDTIDPVITLRSPAKDTSSVVTGLASIELSWTASDNVGLKKVTLNDSEVTGNAGVYTKSVVLHDGPNAFEIKAYDAAGNAGTKKVTVTRPADLSKPGITPPSDQTVASDVATLKLTWKITNVQKAAKITLNGTDLAVSAEVSSDVTLKPGANSFTLVVTDTSGATVTETVVITRTVVVLLPSITALLDRSVGVDQDTAMLTWTITNSAQAKSATLNDQVVSVGPTISQKVTLVPGQNVFKLTLKDSTGTAVSSSVTISRAIDTALLGVSHPSDFSVNPDIDTATLNWTVYNPAKAVSATLNDKPVTVGATIQSSVSLVAGNNTFVLSLKDAKGNQVSDTVIVARAADVTGPSIAWVAPPTKTASVEAAVTSYAVQVKVTDASGVDSVLLNGTLTAKAAGDLYSMTLALPTPDGNPIWVVVRAKDAKGNWSKDSVSVTRKVPDGTDKPVITLKTPTTATGNNLPFETATFHVEANITDPLLAINATSVTIGGVAATATGSVYAADVPVPATGSVFTVTIKAANTSGTASTLDVTVTRAKDNVKPVITPDATTKTQSVDYGTATIALSWTVSDNVAVTGLKYNGLAETTIAATVKKTFPLAVGDNRAVLVATDSAGNSDSSVVIITRKADAVPPVLTPDATTKTQSVEYGTQSIDLSWTVSDNVGVASLKYNGQSEPVAATVKKTLNLAVGDTRAVLIATDSAGNSDSSVVVITRKQDATPPVVAITKPSKDTTVAYGTASVDLTVSATDAGSGIKSLKIGTTDLTATGKATVLLQSGANKIIAVATDNVGNSASDTVTVTVATDMTAPVITWSGASKEVVVGASSANFSATWTVTDNELASVAIDNVAAAAGASNTYSKTVTVSTDKQLINIVAKDKTGNTSTDQLTARLVKAPTITPAGGSFTAATPVTILAPLGTVEYQIGSGAWTAYTVPLTVSTTSSIKARATYGGKTETTVAANFTVTYDVALASITVGTITKAVTGTTMEWDSLDGLTASVQVAAKPNASSNASASINGGSGTATITLIGDTAVVKIIVSNGPATSSEYTLKLAARHTGSLYDSRDKKYYGAIKVGETWWMQANLEFSGANSTLGSCRDGDPNNCKTYGRDYNWNEAQLACPDGWRLPSEQEWGDIRFSASDLGTTLPDLLDVLYEDGRMEFWSSTTYDLIPTQAISWTFGEGNPYNKGAPSDKVNATNVRCIR